jgi:hypothetical protein
MASAFAYLGLNSSILTLTGFPMKMVLSHVNLLSMIDASEEAAGIPQVANVDPSVILNSASSSVLSVEVFTMLRWASAIVIVVSWWNKHAMMRVYRGSLRFE